VYNIRKAFGKINIEAPLLFDEPMAEHTSFRVGGPADLYVEPRTPEEAVCIYAVCREERIPCFPLGEGANILVSDRGIDGVVLSTKTLRGIRRRGNALAVMAGTAMSRAAEKAAESGLAGLETFYSMPGSVGGSVWINARCYGVSVSDRLYSVEIVEAGPRRQSHRVDPSRFGYKKSPFQAMEALILKATFRLEPDGGNELRAKMEAYRADREAKGHFLYPCAGSVFKNDRAFGKPTGKIIDSLGLKGTRLGGAMVSEAHANIIVNTGSASAREIRDLARLVKGRVRAAYGYVLEEEIIPVGRWEEDHV
jgi:UDP-N-acetylmuramate dehydrogenase